MPELIARQVTADGGRASVVRYFPGDFQPRHAHDHPSVALVLAGTVQEDVGASTASAGSLEQVVKPAGLQHADRFGPGGALMVQVVPSTETADHARDGHADLDRWSWRSVGRRGWSWDAGASLLSWVALTRGLLRGADAAEIEDAMAETLAVVAPGRPETGLPPAWLAAVCERLREEAADPPSLGELAAEHGVHRVHLGRAFRRHYGMTPTAFRQRVRLARAVELLHAGGRAPGASMTAAWVAQATGFADQPHMTREFGRWLGVTPRGYRAVLNDAGLPAARRG